jgi:hypothetical protein
MLIDGKALGEKLVEIVRDYVARANMALAQRIDALADQIKAIPAGPKGEAGEKGDPGTPGQDGAPGKDGAAGQDGKPGEAGKDGADGKSFTAEEVRALVDDAVAKAVAMIPQAKDGAPGPSGKDGEPGEKGDAGINGKDGAAGADGKNITAEDVSGVLESACAKWALDFERRAQDLLQRAIDKFVQPKDGKDGIDGLSIEDLSVEHDGDGGVKLRFARGDLVKEFTLRLPRFKVKGGYREGVDYVEGDGVSFGGSFFVANKDAPAGKPGESEDWWLAAKRGRDGKDAVTIPLAVREPVKLR